jgi:arylsulfatase A-like enzyme
MGQTRAGGQRDPKRPPTPLLRDDKVIEEEPDQRYLRRRYTDEALRFITDSRSRPFFLYLAHSFPHWPHYASETFAGKSANGVYGDCIEEVDWSVGQILRVAKDGPKLGSTPLAKPELFNIDADIGETTDVAVQHPAVVDQLLKLIDRCREDIGDGDKPSKNQRPAGRYPGAKPLTAAEGTQPAAKDAEKTIASRPSSVDAK